MTWAPADHNEYEYFRIAWIGQGAYSEPQVAAVDCDDLDVGGEAQSGRVRAARDARGGGALVTKADRQSDLVAVSEALCAHNALQL